MVLGFADEMKRLSENIATSCDVRMKSVKDIIKNANSTLRNFHADRLHMSEEQKAELANFKKNLISETQKLRVTFAKEYKEMATVLREDLSKFHARVSSETHAMLRETHTMLNEFKTDFQDMAQKLHSMLSGYYKGDIKKPVHDMLGAFHNEMTKLADEFHKAHNAWIGFSRSMSAKRRTIRAPEEMKSSPKARPKRAGGRKRKVSRKK